MRLGAEKVGWARRLIATCVLREVHSYVYLVEVLQRIHTHPFSQIQELMPRVWKTTFADQSMKSLDLAPQKWTS